MRKLSRTIALLVLGVLGTVSCVLDELTTADLCGRLAYPSAACGECAAASCCVEANACDASPACRALFDCVASCAGDRACEATCGVAYDTDPAAQALSRCQAENCVTSCRPGAGYITDAPLACDDCVRIECDYDLGTCLDVPFCAERLACIAGCRDPQCQNDCQLSYEEKYYASQPGPLAEDPFVAPLECLGQKCRLACALGEAFSCVGEFEWSTPEAETARYDFYLYDANPSQPTPHVGVSVKACPLPEPGAPCADAVAVATTDAFGYAQLELPLGAAGFDDYFEIQGDDIVTMLRVPRPVTRDGGLTLNVPTRDQFAALVSQVQAGLEPDERRGHLVVTAADCRQTPAVRVSFEVTSSTRGAVEYYFANGLPVKATETDAATTGDTFGGGWLNLEPVARDVTGYYDIDEAKIQVARVPIPMRAGALTSLELFPEP